jgi:nucleotide-binding universal stress UspA family protein
MKQAHPSLTILHRLVDGDPASHILNISESAKADLIIMGTHGWTGLSRLLMGSVAEKVMRKAPCPVLTIRMPFSNHSATSQDTTSPQIALK